jgi:subtilisin family serine protease
MKISFLVLLMSTTLWASSSCPKVLKIAIVDTGLDLSDPRFDGHICPKGHKTFTSTGIADTIGHGTHIAGLIQQYAGDGPYCFLIYKYYSEYAPGHVNLQNESAAFQEAIRNGADIVNFSAGGPEFNEDEYLMIKNHPEVTFIVAAGNERSNLDLPENGYFPASYFLKNEIVVGALDSVGNKLPHSNWGRLVKIKEIGQDVLSLVPYSLDSTGLARKTGTSQATAIHTGKEVAKRLRLCHSQKVAK